MKNYLILILPIFIAACDTTPNYTQRVQPTPLQACVSDVRSDATICELSALGSVKRGVPDSYHQCGIRKRIEEDRCRERFDPNFVKKSNPSQQIISPPPQRRAVQPQFKPNLVKEWIGRNAERFCQYSDGSVRNVGYDLCD
jgi:hypothetical protein